MENEEHKPEESAPAQPAEETKTPGDRTFPASLSLPTRAKNRIWTFLLGALTGGLITALLLLVGSVRYLNQRLSASFEDILRKTVFVDSNIKFESAGIDILKGQLFLNDVSIVRSSKAGMSWTAKLKKVMMEVPLRDVLSGEKSIQRIRIIQPILDVTVPKAQPAQGSRGSRSIFRSRVNLGWLEKLPLSEVSMTDGIVRLLNPVSGKNILLDITDGRIRRSGSDKRAVSLKINGRLPSASGEGLEPGQLYLRTDFQELSSLCNSEGAMKLEQIPIPVIAGFFPSNPGLRFTRGQLTLNAHFTCKDDWISASYHVEIKDFHLEVSEDKKDVFGIPVKYAKPLYDIDSISFVIPVTGSIDNPHIGIQSSIEQILLKILQKKYDDSDKIRKVAKRGAEYFAKKFEKALRK